MYLMYLSLFLAYDKYLSHTKVGRKCVCSWWQIEREGKRDGEGQGEREGRGGEENGDRKKIRYSVRTAGDLASWVTPEPAASVLREVLLEMCNSSHYPRFTESESAFSKIIGDLCAYLSSTVLFSEWQIQAKLPPLSYSNSTPLTDISQQAWYCIPPASCLPTPDSLNWLIGIAMQDEICFMENSDLSEVERQ